MAAMNWQNLPVPIGKFVIIVNLEEKFRNFYVKI